MEDIGSVHMPRLRPGLRFTPGREAGKDQYILEDTARHMYYRIGPEEYLLLAHLNHASSIEDLLQQCAAASTHEILSPEQAMTVLKWAASRQLLQTDSPEMFNALLGQDNQMKTMRALNRMNLVSFKIPLGNPDPLLKKISPWLRPLTGPVFGLLWFIAGVLALSALFSNWQAFHARSAGFFAPANLFLIWLIWLGLKVLHELFHALVCYRYGGRIHEAGILFILFMPFTYVDATSSWNFPSSRQRLHVAAAGIFSELAVAWIALLVWAAHPDSTTGLIAHRTVIVAGISSLLFNGNPLMRFDGYYILSDLTGIPNLYQMGLQSTKEFWARLLLGIKTNSTTESLSHGKRMFIRVYGVMVYIWRFLVLASLGYMASKLFGGLGILISLAALLVWIVMPLHGFIARWPTYKAMNPHVARDLLLRSFVLACVAGILLATVGWKRPIRAPAVVEYEHQYRVKTKADGFVAKILVRDGEKVTKGQPLLILNNPERRTALNTLKLELERIRLQARIAYNSGHLPAMQVLKRKEQALQTQLRQEEEEVASLHITAPDKGTVIAPHIAQLTGTYLKKGREILWIVNPGRKHLVASIAQNDIDRMRALVDHTITIDMRDSDLGFFTGRVERISPTASTELIHPGLAAKYGGPIDVLEKMVARGTNSMRQQLQMQFFNPRFSMEITLPGDLVHKLHPGQIAYVLARGPRVTLRQKINDIFSAWIKNKDRAAAARGR